jgi:hypothetical protein
MLRVNGLHATREQGGPFGTTDPVQPCLGCGARVRLKTAHIVWAFRREGGVTLVRLSEEGRLDPEDDMGMFPVCRDCAKRYRAIRPYLLT